MNWFRSLDTIVRRVIVAAVIVLLLVVIGLTVGYCRSREATREARGERDVASSQSGLGSDALKRADDLATANAEGQAQTDQNTDFITGADNAKSDAGEAGNRGRLAFCDRQRVRQRPEPGYCAELRRAYSAQP